jgi:hypothetical protein
VTLPDSSVRYFHGKAAPSKPNRRPPTLASNSSPHAAMQDLFDGRPAPPLDGFSEAQSSLVDRLRAPLEPGENSGKVIRDWGFGKLTRESFSRLQDPIPNRRGDKGLHKEAWLDSVVLDCAGCLIRRWTPRCHVFEHDFWAAVTAVHTPAPPTTSSQQRANQAQVLARLRLPWGNVDLLGMERWIFIVHVDGQHWALVVVDFPRQLLVVVDSAGRASRQRDELLLKTAQLFLNDEHIRRRGTGFDFSSWRMTSLGGVSGMPEQPNRWDCGVHTAAAMFCVAYGYDLRALCASFDASYWRRRITHWLAHGAVRRTVGHLV